MKKIDPRSTTLLIIDMQNDVVHPKGGWAAAGSPAHAKKQNAVAHIKAIAERARRKRMPVIHVLHAVSPGGRDARQNAPLFRNLVKSGNNRAGSWGAELMRRSNRRPTTSSSTSSGSAAFKAPTSRTSSKGSACAVSS